MYYVWASKTFWLMYLRCITKHNYKELDIQKSMDLFVKSLFYSEKAEESFGWKKI
jgi:hypothetical protein